MYAFRKPFTVGVFEGSFQFLFFPPIDYKILFIVSQVLGYTLSKFLGIKFVSETPSNKRIFYILSLIGFAEISLIFFGLVPPSYRFFFLFLNGLPLGMLWGLIFSFLEGRKSSELLGAGLSTSYIVASGFVKSAGQTVLNFGVDEKYMPFITGLIFMPGVIFSIWLLSRIPPPTKEEEIARTKRVPMNKEARKEFFKSLAPGLICLTVFYMFLTSYRDFRDNFSREIWESLGYSGKAHIYTSSEIPIAITVLLVLTLIMFIRSNKNAVNVIHALLILGSATIGISTLLFQLELIKPMVWMVSIGLGLYLGYVPFGCVLFDRIVASTGKIGTAAFTIYLTDAFGYLGSVFMLFFKNFGPQISLLDFFIKASYITSFACSIGFSLSMLYFSHITKVRSVEKHDKSKIIPLDKNSLSLVH